MPTEGLRGLAEKTPSVAHFPAYPSRFPPFFAPYIKEGMIRCLSLIPAWIVSSLVFLILQKHSSAFYHIWRER